MTQTLDTHGHATSHRSAHPDAPQSTGEAAHQVVHDSRTHLAFHVPGGLVSLELPPPERLVFYGGLTVAAALGAVTWPVAVLTGIGHALADDRTNRTLEALGEAIEGAV